MNVSPFPVLLVVNDLVHVRISELNVVGIGIDEVTEIEPVADIHKQASLSVCIGECHLRVQVAILVGRSSRLVRYDGRVDQVAVTDERHVPQSPETGISDSANYTSEETSATVAESPCLPHSPGTIALFSGGRRLSVL